MNDRELLELAAEAAGYEINKEFSPLKNGVIVGYGSTSQPFMVWNPLGDDGAALRLAVKLGISVYRDEYDGALFAEAVPPGTHQGFDEPHIDDPYAATRRAITRAAAEIARQSKEGKDNG